jgi:hypothetical protein
VFEENDALASKAASEENDDGARLEGGTRSCRMDCLSGLKDIHVNAEVEGGQKRGTCGESDTGDVNEDRPVTACTSTTPFLRE